MKSKSDGCHCGHRQCKCEFVLRSVPWVCLPEWAVVETDQTGGTDVAWFFTEKDARDYIQWKSQ